MSKYKQGDIVFINFPFSDGSSFKPRPALIISNDSLRYVNEVIFLPITGTRFKDKLGFNINNNMVVRDMPKNSQIRLNKIFAMDKKLVIKKVNELKPKYLEKVSESFVNLIRIKQ